MGVLDRLGPELVQMIDQRVHRRVRRLAHPVRGLLVSVRATSGRMVAAATGRAGEAVNGGEVEIAQHFGFTSVPPPAIEHVAVPIGGSSGHQVIVGEIDTVYRPTDVESGGAVIYAIAGNQVRVNADGSVEVRTASNTAIEVTPTGQVLLAGGGAPVARQGDAVSVMVGSTTYVGTITSGSSSVQAGG